jgi:hypothetical protein
LTDHCAASSFAAASSFYSIISTSPLSFSSSSPSSSPSFFNDFKNAASLFDKSLGSPS